jgi:hypothetical protein
MSPRQMLRSFEVRAPESPRVLGQRTDGQVRRYPDASGAEPINDTMQDHLDIVSSRIRLNAGALDWREGPSGGGSSGITPGLVIGEVPVGAQDGQNLVFMTAYVFSPQTMSVFVNGMRQQVGADGASDFTISESGGRGTGYNTVLLSFALLGRDAILLDYEKAAITAP